jgi:exopolysaccharide production protein ExoQ
MDLNLESVAADMPEPSAGTGLAYAVGFFFAFRIFFPLLAVRVFGGGPQDGVIVSLFLNYLLLCAAAFQTLGAAPRPFSSVFRLPAAPWVILFLALSGCSLTWSIAVSLSAAAAFWCALAADVCTVVLLLRNSSVEKIASSLMKGYVDAACLTALIAWIMPAQSDLRLGDEELLGTNTIAYVFAFGIFLAQYLVMVKREKGRWKLALGFLAATLLRSLSKTAIIAMLVAQAAIMLLGKPLTRRTKIKLGAGALAVIGVSWSLLDAYVENYSNNGNQAETLSGRLGIWAIMLSDALERPWFGHGFHSVWKVLAPYGPDQFEIRHAHNEILQQFYAYGAVGLLLWAALYWSVYRQAKKLVRSELKTLVLGMLVFALVRGLTDTEVFDVSFFMWAMVMFSALMAEEAKTSTATEPVEAMSVEEENRWTGGIEDASTGLATT